MIETWRPAAGFPDYEVSDHGSVRRATPGGNATYVGKLLRPATVRGYLYVGLSLDQCRKTVAVHKLVCAAFHGPKPTAAHQVAHGDGNRKNNCAGNLRWATSKENHSDRIAHGTAPRGERNGRAKLSQDAAEIIRNTPRYRGVLGELAARFGVSVGTINMVRQANSPVWRGL